MGSSRSGGSDSYGHSFQNDQFEQIRYTASKFFEYLDELRARGKHPSQKLVGLICKLADGEFIRNEDLEKFEYERKLLIQTNSELEYERSQNKALQNEIELLKEYLEQVTTNRQSFTESYDYIKNKFDKSKNGMKKDIGGIVEFY
uniref:hypothetical protein n=1 Tax=Niallia taxi TaxID=2499688 RepID=UPI003F490769